MLSSMNRPWGFIHFLTDGHLSISQILAIMNPAARNIHVLSLHDHRFSLILDICERLELWAHRADVC